MNSASESFVHRVCYTPLIDLLRGRVSARLDWRSVITHSQLPPEVQRVVMAVVKKTRLWRSERVDVATELIAHFQDGLDAGKNVTDLVTSFGDPKLAARLIRRSKKRNRIWVWQVWLRNCQAFGALVLVYVAAFALLAMRHPQPSVDYVAKMNTIALSTPEANKAWPIYRRAWIDGRIWDLSKDLDALEVAAEGGNSHLVRPSEPGWEKVKPLLDRHAELIAATRAGAAKPHLGLVVGFDTAYEGEDRLALFGPVRANEKYYFTKPTDHIEELVYGSTVGVLLPHLSHLRHIGQLLALDMAWASSIGNGARIISDYQALLGFAGQTREDGTIICQLICISIINLANQTLADALHEHAGSFTDAQLTELAHLSGRTEPFSRMSLIGEQGFMLDSIQRIYSDDGNGDGRITLDGLRVLQHFYPLINSQHSRELKARQAITLAGFPVGVALHASRREITDLANSMFGEMEAQADQSLWILLHSDNPVEKRIVAMHASALDRVRFEPLVVLMPSLNRAVINGKQTQALGEAVAVALSLELYHRRHGTYPATLAELVPHYLPASPLDHSTGLPLIYKLRDGKPLLYGRGMDAKDDGGVWEGKGWPRVPDKGDWVLYPPVVIPPVTPTTQSAS